LYLLRSLNLDLPKILIGWNEIAGDTLTLLLLLCYGYFITDVGAMLLLFH
jgi:hypothetical protein